MLKLKHIVKDYITKQQTVHVLKDFSLNFRECEFVTILGQSGCGKTTLLNIIGGLDRYTDGDIVINGRSTKDFDDRDWDKYRNKQIGFVFQSYNLIPHFDVLHNVELALTLAGKKSEIRKEKAMDALRKVGLEDQAYKKPNQLSGGQMQRVAIARALVNDPAIILADEPTGALDSESGTMVMELLKEVAEDRLVILVSHNADLASQYSTRTVQLKDGIIVDDSDPFFEEGDEEVECVTVESACGKKTIKQRFKKTYKQIAHERREERKVSMNGATTIGMSARNLYSKKWRTFLTSFAGSIGIIGIALVLALSAGVNNYIILTEKSALSLYPMTVSNSGIDITQLAEMLITPSTGEKYPNSTDVLVSKIAGLLLYDDDGNFSADNLSKLVAENDLSEIKTYLDDKLDLNDGYAQYIYNSSQINVYRQIPTASGDYLNEDGFAAEEGDSIPYSKINPFADSLSGLAEKLNVSGIDAIFAKFKMYLDMFTVFSELINSQEILSQQYDVLYGNWPSAEGYTVDEDGNKVFECVVKVDEFNKIPDYMLFAAGLANPNEVMDMLGLSDTSTQFFDQIYTGEKLLDVEYAVLSDSDYIEPFYTYDETSGTGTIDPDYNKYYANGKKTGDSEEFIDMACGIRMKVVGVVRPRENATAASIAGIIGYPHSLVEAVISRCQDSTIVKAQTNNCYYNGNKLERTIETVVIGDVEIETEVFTDTVTGEELSDTEKLGIVYKNILTGYELGFDGQTVNGVEIYNITDFMKAYFGYAEVENPDEIRIFASSFFGKNEILQLFEEYKTSDYNSHQGNTIKYEDMFATIMDYVKQLTNAMITALIAFSAISLIVSSIMISIITYTSVLERRKEIGVLRSIGARKLDISNLFITESSIIGIFSGVMGIAFGYLFVYIANLIIFQKLEIEKLLSLDWFYSIALIVISFLLALVAGIIPASIAARKDPVEALRTE